MALVIVIILILCYMLLATANITKVNKAAVAMFAGAIGWVLYICYGSDFVMNIHSADYAMFLDGAAHTSERVKMYIADNIFLKYVGQACGIVLFLLATMTIIEILNNNGCFDFVSQLLKTRSSKRFLWMLSVVTFVISANLDNLTTTVMMLTIMRKIIPSRKQRLIFGSTILISANCGGALTVIGDPIGLALWNMGAVTASNFSLSLLLPCLAAWFVPTFMLGKMLPERIETEWITMPFRGDDTRLNVWQRLMMLFVGIGGLWFIPTFHTITKLSPFLGACCVLAVLWVVNEAFNRKLINDDAIIQRPIPRVLQYGVLQMMLFVMGIVLASGVVKETGALDIVKNFFDNNIHNIWIVGILSAIISCLVDSFANAYLWITTYDPTTITANTISSATEYQQLFVQNGQFWKLLALTSALGANVLAIGSMSGLALIKSERIPLGWYIKNVSWKVATGAIIAIAIMFLTTKI